ncbi:MAG: Sir2 family NAD-dependent protein deacetylase, partial [Succinivibrio sp.]
HLAIARLQKEWPAKSGGSAALVTQNIDNMHEKAGSADPIHMHGYLFSMLCRGCGGRFPFDGDSHPDDKCPLCGARRTRPDIVFFEEMPYQMDRIGELLSRCDLFLSIGTSGVVYPAAGFCREAKAAGALCVEFNLAPSATGSQFDYGLYGKATKTVPAFVDRLLSDGTALEEVPE